MKAMGYRQWAMGAAGALALTALVLVPVWWQHRMERALPPQTVCASQAQALDEAYAAAGGNPLRVCAVLGTGSMAPYIPGAPLGRDPLKTVAAFVVFRAGATFADIRQGDLVCYHADWLPAAANTVLHQAAQHDGDGWIMSGLHNKSYESAWRVTAKNFVGIVARSYVWPLEVGK